MEVFINVLLKSLKTGEMSVEILKGISSVLEYKTATAKIMIENI